MSAATLALSGHYQVPFGLEEQEVILRLLRDGAYRRAVTRIATADPDVADQ